MAVTVLARGVEGRELEGADVFVRRGDRTTFAGTTDEGGALDLGPLAPWSQVVGRKPGYGPAVATWPDGDATIVLRLERSASISGRVVVPGGEACGAGLNVLAYPLSGKAGFHQRGMVDALMLDPQAAVATTDSAGEFVLQDLDPRATYDLFAGGDGWIQDEGTPVRARAGETGVLLQVARAYALLVTLEEPNGEPVRFGRFFGPGTGFASRVMTPDAYQVSPASPAPWLAGVPLEFADLPPSTRLYVFTSKNPHPEGVTFEVTADPPGYRGVEVPLHAPLLTGGPATVPLTLLPVGDGWGELHIEWSRPAGWSSETGRVGQFGELRLSRLDGRQKTFSLALRDERRSTHILEGIPHGRYELRLELLPGLLARARGVSRLGEVRIGSAPARVVVDLSGTGAIDVAVRDSQGQRYSGELSLFVALGSAEVDPDGAPRRAGGMTRFSGPPYRLPAVAPGTYMLQAVSPGVRSTVVETVVGPGARVETELEIPH